MPNPVQWSNYNVAFMKLLPNMINTIIVVVAATAGSAVLASMSGYVFARLTFPGKQLLYFLVLSLLMIPSVLTLTPLYTLVQDLGMKNTWWVLIIPWMAGSQAMGVLLCQTFIQSQPSSLFESARIDGASEFGCYLRIAVPLAKPILATMVIMNMNGFYNDYIWPLITIDSTSKQVISVAVKVLAGSGSTIQIGNQVAGYVIATVPLLILFLAGSRLYIEGLTAGAIKA